MKQPIFPLILVIVACLAGCKPMPANQLSSIDTTATPQGTDRVVIADISDTNIIPRPIGYVNDYIRLFTSAQFNTLDSLVRSYERRTTNEISIVILDTALIDHQNFDSYTLQMARKWGVGKKGKDNGILIAISPGLKRMRIQNGLGIEKIMSNEATKAIIDSIFTPHFKKGDYFEGTRQGVIAIMARLNAKL